MIKMILLILSMTVTVWPQDDKDTRTELIGSAWYQGGQVLNGTYSYNNDIKNFWYQKVFANLGFKKKVNNWLSITAAIEANLRLSFKRGSTFIESQFYTHNFYIDQARGDITPIQNRFIKLRLTLGYFHFHYNESTRNLGNVLFKSSCYPTAIIQQEFDQQEFDQQKRCDVPFLRQCGLNLNTTFLDGLIFYDFLATTYIDVHPAGDLSVTDIFGLYWRGIKACAGVQLDRVLPLSSDFTTPRDAQVVDEVHSDTTQFTQAGTKFMAYVSLDIKKIIFSEDYPQIFGINDAKIFFEINILGKKNYNHFYEKRNERMPVVFGILMPTFKILDVLCIEFEHFGSLYPNSLERPINSNKPYPDIQEYDYLPQHYKNDDWKWSWYAKRSFSNFSIIFQFAHDHLWLWSTRSVDQVFRDNLVDANKDFYYQLKFLFRF